EGELSLGSREAPMLVGLAEPGVVVLSQLTKTCRDLTVGDRLHTRGASKQRVELVRGREHRATGRVTPDGRDEPQRVTGSHTEAAGPPLAHGGVIWQEALEERQHGARGVRASHERHR